jgi:hypothetical protein
VQGAGRCSAPPHLQGTSSSHHDLVFRESKRGSPQIPQHSPHKDRHTPSDPPTSTESRCRAECVIYSH